MELEVLFTMIEPRHGVPEAIKLEKFDLVGRMGHVTAALDVTVGPALMALVLLASMNTSGRRCHQLIAHSLNLKGAPSPLCATTYESRFFLRETFISIEV
jgi:hypothetical protein